MTKNAIELLLDESYEGEVELIDNDGKRFSVIAIAVVPYDKQLYAIVIDKVDYDKGNFEEGGYVLHIQEEINKISVVKNVNIISEVFEIYDRLFEERVDL